MIKHIILDLDGTLCDERHRAHLRGDWDNYHAECINDMVNPIVKNIVSIYHNDYDFYGDYLEIIIITGRTENFRSQTIDWLQKHHIYYNFLYMREIGNYEKSTDFKKRILEKHYDRKLPNPDETLILEDNDSIIQMYRELGYLPLKVQI